MNQSLLSSRIFEAVSEAKPQRLMGLMWVSSGTAAKAAASQHELLWRAGAQNSFVITPLLGGASSQYGPQLCSQHR